MERKKRMRLNSIMIMSACVLLLSGCASSRKPGFPRQSYDEKALIEEIEEKLDLPTKIISYYDSIAGPSTPDQKMSRRNEIITTKIALIDLNYNQFLACFSFNKQTIDTAADLSQLGINLATTIIDSSGPQSVLGAASAGIVGTRLSIDKNFFYEKTVPVLISAMNAQRKEALIPILEGLKLTAEEYSLSQALSDTDTYYFAGTFVGALQTLQKDSGKKEAVAEEQLYLIRKIEGSYIKDIPGEMMKAYAKLSEQNEANLKDWIAHDKELQEWLRKKNLTTMSLTFFYRADALSGIRKRAAKEMKLIE